ncbi:MAG: PIN domain-containing protein [Candidatus Promineofilum sp.]|nr:PIN domain-containing protein [Promineifilum sp.]
MTIRIFLDASALFAAAYSSTGAARELLRLNLEKRVQLITNQIAVEEAERNLERKAPEGVAIFWAILNAFPIEVLSAPDLAEIQAAGEYVVPKDAPILAGAIASGAEYLATFDRQHLIGIDVGRIAPNLVIATPGDILGQIR